MAEWMIQSVEVAHNEACAQAMLESQRGLEGFRGGRVLPPGDIYPLHRVQVFYEDIDEADRGLPLPEGMRRVLVLDGQRQMLGIVS